MIKQPICFIFLSIKVHDLSLLSSAGKQEKDCSIPVTRRGKREMIGSPLKWEKHLGSKEEPIARPKSPKSPLSDVPADKFAGMLAYLAPSPSSSYCNFPSPLTKEGFKHQFSYVVR